jgi:predicted acyltransferase
VVLAACYWIVDIRGWRVWGRPFVILGSNAIALFVLSGLLTKVLITVKVSMGDGTTATLYRYLYLTLYAPLLAPKNASLLFAATHLAILFGVLYVMYRRRIFLKA